MSLKYINPYNKPDLTEIEALKKFERQKGNEFVKIEKIGEFTYFRLIKPLITERECLKCHAQQGYTEGSVRGALSIFIPLDETLQQLSFYKKILFLIFAFFFLILNLTVVLLSNRFIFRPLYCTISLLKILRNLYGESFQDRSSPSLLQVKNEWELLFDSINKFIQEINYYQERLEERVREVTKDLEEKNKMLQNLLERRKLLITNMAHELKTPLTSVKGSIDYLKRQLELKKDHFEKYDFERFWEFLEISQKNVKRLIDLFNALIDLEKAEANLLELEFTSFNLRELVEEVIDYLKGFALSKGLVFKINVREDLYLFADREKLAIVLSNLLHNAIKFSPEGGEVTISAYEKKDKIRVSEVPETLGLLPSFLLLRPYFRDNLKGRETLIQALKNQGFHSQGLFQCLPFHKT